MGNGSAVTVTMLRTLVRIHRHLIQGATDLPGLPELRRGYASTGLFYSPDDPVARGLDRTLPGPLSHAAARAERSAWNRFDD